MKIVDSDHWVALLRSRLDLRERVAPAERPGDDGHQRGRIGLRRL